MFDLTFEINTTPIHENGILSRRSFWLHSVFISFWGQKTIFLEQGAMGGINYFDRRFEVFPL